MADPDYTGELWKIIPEYPNYAVSDCGRVKRITATKEGRVGHCLKHAYIRGYAAVSLRNGTSPRKLVAVHSLVVRAFHGDRPSDRHQAAHKDGNRANPRADNLRWATPEENAADKVGHGTSIRGSANPRARLTAADVLDIRRRAIPHVNTRSIAVEFGISPVTVRQIVTKRLWPHL